MAWRLFNRFWHEDYSTLDNEGEGQAAYVNLHKWKTEEPIKPHYHFHCLVPNYRLVENGNYQDEEGNTAIEFKQKSYYQQKGGSLVPFSDEVRDLMKRRWHSRLVKFATRHGMRDAVPEDYKKINIFVEYCAWGDSRRDKARLMNKLNYQSRHWLEDYAEYSNEHLDCADPPKWLESYNNNARVFGWWREMSSLTRGVEMESKEKLSPLDGEPMEYQSTISLEGLMWRSGGRLGTLESYKGQPLFGDLTPGDIDWMKSVMWRAPPEIDMEV